MRSTRSIEILCLALAALVLVWSRAFAAHAWAAAGLLGAYAVAIAAFRSRRFLPGRTRLRLCVESWSMVAFIGGALWLSGRLSSPLLNLYLLPVILSALTLGRPTTLVQVAVISASHLLFAAATPGLDPATLAYASLAVGQLAPILLVAYLTSTLAADVTEARERIEDLAQTDPLTGLLNQRMFNEVWTRLHAAAEKPAGAQASSTYALLVVDIDQLKTVNDAFGHESGNDALRLVAEALRGSVRTSDHVARFGGDEFTVLLPGASAADAEIIAKRARNSVWKTTLNLRSRMIRCSVSIGVAVHPRDSRDMRELYSIADRNMYRDKELRRAADVTANA